MKEIGGLAGWLIRRVQRRPRTRPRLEVLERLTLAPRQSLALIEADGQRILVATAAEGAPAFYPLDSGSEFDLRIPVMGQIPLTGGKPSW